LDNFSGKFKSGKNQIPAINRDASLLTRLLPIVIIGCDGVLDKKGQLYFRLLCRLVDKSFDEYSTAKEYIEREIETGNKLEYRFSIINHLENCINAINRAAKTLKSSIKGENKLLEYMSKESLETLKKCDASTIRNRVEHIDEDIQKGKFRGQLFLDVDNNYEKICINYKCVTFRDLTSVIESYHKAVLEICNNLPNR
jgi:hypothetical protein